MTGHSPRADIPVRVRAFAADATSSCAIVCGTIFARCRCHYRPRRRDPRVLLSKAGTVTAKHPRKLDTQSIWIVVAAFNEATVIGPIVSDLLRPGYHVVVVDDGSDDATGQIALSVGATVVTHPVNLGQGAALQTGIRFALQQDASYVVTFDADGQHRPSDIARLVDALVDHHAAYALGSRFLGSSREGASRISLRQNRMAHASELLEQIAASGLPHIEVPVTIDYTRYSLAKGQRLSDSLTILFDLSAQKLHR